MVDAELAVFDARVAIHRAGLLPCSLHVTRERIFTSPKGEVIKEDLVWLDSFSVNYGQILSVKFRRFHKANILDIDYLTGKNHWWNRRAGFSFWLNEDDSQRLRTLLQGLLPSRAEVRVN